MLGFTEEELTEYFDEHMHAHAEIMGLSFDGQKKKLLEAEYETICETPGE